ncbi:MAG: hypothetical protein WBA13_04785 [Microcoleaceae cyanobacterium]
MRSTTQFAQFSAGFILLLLLVFGILHGLSIPAGSFLDWVIGGGIFWWLMLIVTIPWNVHFEAKEVLAEAEESKQKYIQIDSKKLTFVQLLSRRSLWVAIGLHLVSALGLYVLAITGISVVGYIGSGAALLLTIARPTLRGYQYVVTRLSMVRREFSYPRQDILELRQRFDLIEAQVKSLTDKLNPNQSDSWVSTQTKKQEILQQDLTRLATELEIIKAENISEHRQLSKVTETAIAQLSADGEFLNHAREIIRFFKQA